MKQTTHARMILFLGALCLGSMACSGVAPKTKSASKNRGSVQIQKDVQGLQNYPSWRALSEEAMRRGGDGVQWSLFGLPTSSVQNGRFTPGTILVKEVRAVSPGGKPGAVVRLDVMTKGADGLWRYEAYNGKTLERDSTIDTDGCTLCHEDKADDDFTFRARSIFDKQPSLAPPP